MTDDNGERPLVHVAFPAGDPPREGVALVTLDRPDALNALSFGLLEELDEILAVLDDDDGCRAIVLTGAGTRAFAAGADIRELAGSTRGDLHRDDPFAAVDRVGRLRTPVIAAVRGYALGGGCELAMACDMLIAADDATFGQPEIGIGVIPGAGGTQRLARAIGKARAMELVLTGRRIKAPEAERLGLVTAVVPADEVVERALALARRRRRDAGPRGAGREGRGQRRAGAAARRWPALRARPVRGPVRDRGPARGDARVPRQAAAAWKGR